MTENLIMVSNLLALAENVSLSSVPTKLNEMNVISVMF